MTPRSLTCLGLLAAAGAGAAEWKTSFPPEALASYFESPTAAVLVAAAGDPADECRRATSAVEEGLRLSGRVRVVLGDAALGRLSGISDADLVAKARSYPVQRVVVVRVFAGGPGQPPQAVVVLYALDGKALASMTTAAGTPLAAKPAPEAVEPAVAEATKGTSTGSTAASGGGAAGAASAGTGSQATASSGEPIAARPDAGTAASAPTVQAGEGTGSGAASVPSPAGGPVAAGSGPAGSAGASTTPAVEAPVDESWREQAITFRFSVPYQGRAKDPLEGALFYEVLNHPELAQRYEENRGRRATALLASGLVVFAGATGAVFGLLNNTTGAECFKVLRTDTASTCLQYTESWGPRVALGSAAVAGVGLLGLLGALIIDVDPASASERRRLVNEFNQKLQQPKKPAPSGARASPRVGVGLVLAPGQAGLSLCVSL